MATINLQAANIPNWRGTAAALELRVAPDEDFVASDGTLYFKDTRGSLDLYTSVNCPVVNGTIQVPILQLPTTTDALDNKNATFSAWFYVRGKKEFAYFENWVIPADIGANPAYADLLNYNRAYFGGNPFQFGSGYGGVSPGAPVNLSNYYSKIEVDALFAGLQTELGEKQPRLGIELPFTFPAPEILGGANFVAELANFAALWKLCELRSNQNITVEIANDNLFTGDSIAFNKQLTGNDWFAPNPVEIYHNPNTESCWVRVTNNNPVNSIVLDLEMVYAVLVGYPASVELDEPPAL